MIAATGDSLSDVIDRHRGTSPTLPAQGFSGEYGFSNAAPGATATYSAQAAG